MAAAIFGAWKEMGEKIRNARDLMRKLFNWQLNKSLQRWILYTTEVKHMRKVLAHVLRRMQWWS